MINQDDPDDELPTSVRVVSRVAAVIDRSPTELPSLYEVVDPDALDALVDADGVAVSVGFDYAGTRVVVDGDGRLRVEPVDDPSAGT